MTAERPTAVDAHGKKFAVLAGEGTTDVVVMARAGDGWVRSSCPPRRRPEPVHSLDASRPLAEVALHHVFVPSDRALGEPGSDASTLGISRAIQEATVGLALETVGTCDALFQFSWPTSRSASSSAWPSVPSRR